MPQWEPERPLSWQLATTTMMPAGIPQPTSLQLSPSAPPTSKTADRTSATTAVASISGLPEATSHLLVTPLTVAQRPSVEHPWHARMSQGALPWSCRNGNKNSAKVLSDLVSAGASGAISGLTSADTNEF